MVVPQSLYQGLHRDRLAVLGGEHLEELLSLARRRGAVKIALDAEAPK
jgi:hypothetical protein